MNSPFDTHSDFLEGQGKLRFLSITSRLVETCEKEKRFHQWTFFFWPLSEAEIKFKRFKWIYVFNDGFHQQHCRCWLSQSIDSLSRTLQLNADENDVCLGCTIESNTREKIFSMTVLKIDEYASDVSLPNFDHSTFEFLDLVCISEVDKE